LALLVAKLEAEEQRQAAELARLALETREANERVQRAERERTARSGTLSAAEQSFETINRQLKVGRTLSYFCLCAPRQMGWVSRWPLCA
jgi:hypothetical protein